MRESEQKREENIENHFVTELEPEASNFDEEALLNFRTSEVNLLASAPSIREISFPPCGKQNKIKQKKANRTVVVVVGNWNQPCNHKGKICSTTQQRGTKGVKPCKEI